MEQPRPRATPKRVFTAPARSSVRDSNAIVETLFSHPSVKIISFIAGPRNFPLSPSRDITPSVEIEPGTLPWNSPLERNIAVGPFQIYRAPGSVAFLSCGSFLLHPILPKSQCWCIDEASSKFILQIRRPQYWRIEIPIGDTDSNQRAQLLRNVLDNVLQFEKTPCPFKRAFTVELPERPQTPARKRPWTPVRNVLPPSPVTPISIKSQELERRRATPIQLGNTPRSDISHEEVITPTVSLIDKINYHEHGSEPGALDDEQELELTERPRPFPLLPGRLSGLRENRSVTAPPQLTLNISPPSKPAAKSIGDQLYQQGSPTESSDSFHSVQSWHSPLTPLGPPSPPVSNPPSPQTFPYPHDHVTMPAISHHRDVSDVTVTPVQGDWLLSPTGADILSSDSSETSSVVEDAEKPALNLPEDQNLSAAAAVTASIEPSTPTIATPHPRIRHRATTSSISVSRHRALSPLPPPANLFTPHRQFSRYNSSSRATTRMEAVQRIPGAIIQKTCEILLAPPTQFLALMLNVAARITSGEWRGLVFGTNDRGQSVTVQWGGEDYCWGDVEDDTAEERRGSREQTPDSPIRERDEARTDNQDTEAESGLSDSDWSRSWEVD